MTKQLEFGFVKEIDQATAEKAEQDRQYWKKANADAHLEHCLKELPPDPEEQQIIDKGVRLARHVHEFECEGCNLDSEDHTVGSMFIYTRGDTTYVAKMCLKDYYAKIKEGKF